MDDIVKSTDEELIQKYRDGLDVAFDELYNRYGPKLKRLIYYYIGDSEAADDVFHEVFVRVIKHIDTFDVSLSFSSWIYQIAVNCSKNYLKRRNKQAVLVEKEKVRFVDREEETATPEDEILTGIELKEFNDAVESLGDKFKDVFLLRFDQKMKFADIAESLGCSERTAKWRMKKAVEKIVYYLKERDII